MKINVKLTIYVGIIASIATLILSYTSYDNILESSNQDSDRIIQSLAATVYDTAAISAYLNNEALANDVITGLLKNKRVVCAAIITDKMQTTGGACQKAHKYTKTLYSPFSQDEKIGQLEIVKNHVLVQNIASSIADNKIQGVIVVVTISILFTLITTYLLVSHPIEKLASWLDTVKLDTEQTMRYPHTGRRDEIGRIGYKINQLLNKLDERLNKERALTNQTQKLSENLTMICNLSKNALVVTDTELNLLSHNPEFESVWSNNVSQENITTNHQWVNLLFENADTIKQKIIQSEQLKTATTIEVETKHSPEQKNSENLWFDLTFAKAENAQGELNTFIFISDVTAKRQQLLQSEFEADHDLLTHLKNRRSARRLLNHMMKTPDHSSKIALLLIDLDGFKEVNDTYGHDAGDVALVEIAKRLSHLTRRSDILARWGGDEFIIALNYSQVDEAKTLANKIIHAVSVPINVSSEDNVNLGASIGIAIYPDSAEDFDELFEKADIAMYQIKKQGKNSYQVHS
ncbi:GGDEF domain-containing protein [Catenovulum adriaticum]|uniref:GGDEF domain-containing protein n=1 Tax=Catenovulum adriaticum TaxID=2984846 RepID=A0ABY7ALW0_9ALTE|nr:GGDEF domain-containing protein [Catenovulum sp. TS8]WAJ69717.1 GGDEF domain-containing protein [Catenovulum sp. TS8]